MIRVAVGKKIPDLQLNVAYEGTLNLTDVVGENKTAIVFLRSCGCEVSCYEMSMYAAVYDQIRANEGELIVVLQSSMYTLEQLKQMEKLPFVVVSDPKRQLYKEFGVMAAHSKWQLKKGRTDEYQERAKKIGLSHIEQEGSELQLPATIIINRKLQIQYLHYGKNISDVPDGAAMLDLLRNVSSV